MFNFYNLCSGSSGNSSLLQTDNSKILIDAGGSAKRITEALSSVNVDISSIDAIIVTHEHIDHIQSLGTISKKYNIPVYANIETWNSMPEQKLKILEENQKTFIVNTEFEIKDVLLKPFSIPHDAANPCGFSFFHDEKKASIATDLGHITPEIMDNLSRSKFILLEANYDPNILKCSRYPYPLKLRISGPEGHLSNETCGKVVSKLIPTGLSNVLLGHLSKENNFPELAYKTVAEEVLPKLNNDSDISLGVAKRTGAPTIINIA